MPLAWYDSTQNSSYKSMQAGGAKCKNVPQPIQPHLTLHGLPQAARTAPCCTDAPRMLPTTATRAGNKSGNVQWLFFLEAA